jgi:hypothetical protein
LRLVSDKPVVAGEQRGELVSRLRAVIGAEDEQIGTLGARLEAALAGLEASRERERRLELRLAELERRLGMDSSDSGTPSSKGADRGERYEWRAGQPTEGLLAACHGRWPACGHHTGGKPDAHVREGQRSRRPWHILVPSQ